MPGRLDQSLEDLPVEGTHYPEPLLRAHSVTESSKLTPFSASLEFTRPSEIHSLVIVFNAD
jgi:hypothetical protein